MLKPKLPRTRLELRNFLIQAQIPLLLLLLSLSSCTSGPIPRWDGKLWAGDSASASLVRAQDPNPATNRIPASDKGFDSYLAMSYADFRSFYATYILGCQTWKSGITMMSQKQALDTFKVAVDEFESAKAEAPVKP